MDPSQYHDGFARRGLPPGHLWPRLDYDGGYPRLLNAAAELLDHMVEMGRGSRPCLLSPNVTFTYEQVLDAANRIAAILIDDFGMVSGNRVLLRSANNPTLIAIWLGVLKAGGIAVTTVPLLRARELSQIIERADIQFAFCDAGLHEEIEKARSMTSSLRHLCYFNTDSSDGLAAHMRHHSGYFDNFAPSHDDVALIAFTSGTTGTPKATMHFHRDILTICDTWSASILQPEPDELFAGSPPIGFTFGLGGLVTFPMRVGAASLLLERCTAEILLESIARYRATTIFTAPTLYRAMLELVPNYDLSSLRKYVSGGEHLSASLFARWHKATGIPIINGIGSTEMLHNFLSARPADVRPGAVGRVVPGYRAIIVDEAMNPLPPNALGLLAVQGPTGCRYLNDALRQQEYVRDGWNVTGDVFHVDEDGYFWFHSRTDDLIISAGYNISGAEVEAVLLEHPAVAECVVVGAPDEKRGQIVKAFVVLRRGTSRSERTTQMLRDHVKARIAPYKYPRAIEYVEAIPRTSTGKLQRSALRDRVDLSPENSSRIM